MSGKKYQTILEAYNSIYEVTSAPDPKLADKKPVNPQSAQIAQDLFAKPSAIAPAATSAKPAPTPPVAEKPATPPATPPAAPVSPSPSPTPPAAPAVPQKTFQQELDDLRKASAQATMAGPSKEAQALMSTRTKNILGPEKLRAGIEGQERVEKMKSQIGMPKVETPKPQAPTPPAAPKSQTPTPPPPSETRQPTSPPPPKSDRSKEYQQAWDNRNNPFAKGRIKDAWSKMTPEERKAAKEWAKANNKDWKEMNLPEGVDIYDNVLDYLINEGYADTEEAAIAIMANMSEEWKQSIVEERTNLPKIEVTPDNGKPYFRRATPKRIEELESNPNIQVKRV